MRTALIQIATGIVQNVIELEPGANWRVPDGCVTIPSMTAGIGDTWSEESFIRRPSVAPSPSAAEIAALQMLDLAAGDVVAEIDKAFTVRATALTLTEKTAIKDKVVKLIAKAQGR